MIDPTCGVPFPTPCLPPRRTIFGPRVDSVMSTAATAGADFAIEARAGGVTAPLRVMAQIAQQQAIGEPGDVVLVQGHLQSQTASVQSTAEIRAIDILDFPPRRPQHSPGVKLRIQRCSWPGWIYIDANSHLYVPGGEPISIQLMAPEGWTQLPGATPIPEIPFTAEFVDVRVTACVARCCPTRRAQLTMYAPIDEDEIVLVPPGATELALYAGQGGAIFNSQWQWLNNQGAGFGQFGITGAFANSYLRPGDMSALQHLEDGGTVSAMMVWTVE